MAEQVKTLRLVLGDQINHNHSWFKSVDANVVYLMAEMRQETNYVKHHIQKVIAFFASMRNFAKTLERNGHRVIYYSINQSESKLTLAELISNEMQSNGCTHFEYQLPDEYRLDEQLKSICSQLKGTFKSYCTEHFYTQRTEVLDFFEGKKRFLMENFYRMMRKKHNILMIGDAPVGGQWNFDADNRKKYKGEIPVPPALFFNPNIETILKEIETAQIETIGTVNANSFAWPTSRTECLEQLEYFCTYLLPYFGTYEDAMHTEEKNLFHSRLSFAMNTKMLSPKEVVEKVEQAFINQDFPISIAQAEGFIRQVLGWREYVRGIYWKEMPNYASLNYLENKSKLPNFYWTADTKMNCMKQSLKQSLNDAYAHHIQRLMVIGNFSLLTQMHPDEVDAWYLGVYIDAIEWVELPNTRGMSQYADGGIMATKPYVSSGSYINKMSNYCSNCHYKVKEKWTDDACPFNSLYWDFIIEKKPYFANNQRMSMMLRMQEKMKPEDIEKIQLRAHYIKENLDKI